MRGAGLSWSLKVVCSLLATSPSERTSDAVFKLMRDQTVSVSLCEITTQMEDPERKKNVDEIETRIVSYHTEACNAAQHERVF